MILAMAWRNLWRHPRRTVVILLAVVVGVWAMVFYSALVRGMIEDMVRQNVANLSGHIQVQGVGFFENPVIDHRVRSTEEVVAAVAAVVPPDARWTTRMRAGVVVRSAREALGATLVGISAAEERGISFIGSTAIEGAPLDSDVNGVLVGHALLKRLEARIGHRIVVDVQDATGRVISRAFTIVGTYRAQLEATERLFVFCQRETLQSVLAAGDDVSEVAIVLAKDSGAAAVAAALRARLPDADLRVLTWREMVPFIGAWLESMDLFTTIWNIVVFIAMSFGLVNTVLMAVFERIREFGLVRALGVTPAGIIRGVLMETGMLLLIGFTVGAVAAYASIAVLANVGIDLSAFAQGSELFGMSRVIYPEMMPYDFIRAGATVIILGLIVCLYPAVKAARITPVQAMSHV